MPDLADVAVRFANHLHQAGVEVGPERSGRFATMIQLAKPATNDELYWLGRVTLVGDRGEIDAYDRVFADIFLGVGDIADSRGDSNQPNLEAVDLGRRRPPRSAPTDGNMRGEPRPGLAGVESLGDGADSERESPIGAPVSQEEHLRTRDFAHCTFEELRRLRQLMTALAIAPPLRVSRRRRRNSSGDSIDRRATMRRAKRTGGHPVHLVVRRRTVRRRRVVLIADVSGSMEPYARAYLYLLHGAVKVLSAETFVFATRLTRLTHRLRTGDPELALRTAVGDVDDWSGGTRIGEAIGDFNDRWGRRGLARGAVVVIVSDGWEGGDPKQLGEQMARLARLAHRIIWVNPRSQSERYQPLAGGMAAALPHVDIFASGHSLDALDQVVAAISARSHVS